MSIDKYPTLFTAGEDSTTNACVNFTHDMSIGYIEGYLRAADRLVQHVVETNRDHNFLVYPIAFLYRHHIELRLKSIISTGRKLLTDIGGHPEHHKLHDLWPLAKGILRQTCPNEPDPPEFRTIDSFINRVHPAEAYITRHCKKYGFLFSVTDVTLSRKTAFSTPLAAEKRNPYFRGRFRNVR